MTETVKVTFFSSGASAEKATAEVPRGASVLDAAKAAGVLIGSICGGDGICGRCRVVVRSGDVEAQPTALLTREEIRSGVVLACQTIVTGDVEIDVPAETSGEGAQIVADHDADRFRALATDTEAGHLFAPEPIVRKLHLELPRPSLQDNLGCHERLVRAIQRRVAAPVMQMGLKVLQSLPAIHRQGDWSVTATIGLRGETIEIIQVEEGDQADHAYGIVVDVGTSTVVAHLVDLRSGQTLAAEACYNSQMPYGAEVTRRIIHAERHGAEALREAIVGNINDLIGLLVSGSGVELHDVVAVFAAGNTAMLHFLLGLDPSHIRKSPYVPAATAPPPVRAAEIGIRVNPRGILHSMPSIGSWVGGDVTAGVLATSLAEGDALTMLIDIGTNGEIVLGNADWMLACATSAGPAFEGSGVKCGMRASRGAIERIRFLGSPPTANTSTDALPVEIQTIGQTKPRGICGSGLIDAIAGLFEVGLIDRSGHLLADRSSLIRQRDGILEVVFVPGSESATGSDIVITQADIENVLRAKAAIYAGARILLESTQHAFDDIERLLIAGGFGSYLDIEKAVLLGMIPDLPVDRIHYVGNTSLLGAKMALLSEEALRRSHEIARSATYFDLITVPHYYEEFMSAKFLPHTDLDLFPSAARIGEGTGLREAAKKERK